VSEKRQRKTESERRERIEWRENSEVITTADLFPNTRSTHSSQNNCHAHRWRRYSLDAIHAVERRQGSVRAHVRCASQSAPGGDFPGQ
jgi:hypothetical protein